jgi:hypothetical protein
MTAVAMPGSQNKSQKGLYYIMKRLIAVALVSLFITPAFACGPGMSPGREKWTRNRIQILKNKRKAEKGEKATNLGTDAISRMQQANDPFAQTVNDTRREQARRQKDIDTIEFLALKKERGELSPAGQQKLDALLRHYRQ